MTLLHVPQILAAESTGTSFWQLVVTAIKASSAIEVGILILLLVMSVTSWGIVLWKYKLIRAAVAGNQQIGDAFIQADNLSGLSEKSGSMPASPNVLVYRAAYDALASTGGNSTVINGTPAQQNPLMAKRKTEERVQMIMEHASRNEFTRMHRGMDLLASIASASPFIGLFGTVLGIMHTFQILGTAKSASLAVIAPGIAAALIATAAGLAVAIPAVFFYNFLSARMDEVQEQADMFIESLGQFFLSTGAFKHTPANAHVQSHEAAEPMIVGEGSHVPGNRV